MALPGMGYFAVCHDTENNSFGLWESTEHQVSTTSHTIIIASLPSGEVLLYLNMTIMTVEFGELPANTIRFLFEVELVCC
jgi:hypothetical protein